MPQMNKLTRRDFVKRTAVAGAGVALLTKFAVPSAKALNNSMGLRKWVQPLRGLNHSGHPILSAVGYPSDPNGIPVANGYADPVYASTMLYQIGVQEYSDWLHPDLGTTTNPQLTKLWGYVDLTRPMPRHLGGLIVTGRAGKTLGSATRIRFTNNLPSRHLLPLDITLPGANLAQNRIATHLHGGFIPWISDGGPFDWFSPGCPDYTSGLSFLNGPTSFLNNLPALPPLTWPAGVPYPGAMVNGQADYFYPNNQSTRLMWYHDHAWGTTRLNAYAGIATGYLCIDLANDALRLTGNVPPYADLIPLVWQDKKFVSSTTPVTDPTWADVTRSDVQTVGSLWYEHTYNPKLWTLKAGLPLPDPSVIAEYFGDTMLCNGSVYPKLTVDPKAYRFMFLNATNARFFNINTFMADTTTDGITLDLNQNSPTYLYPLNTPGPVIRQIGNEGGYLAKEVAFTTVQAGLVGATDFNPKTLTGNLIMGPAERADVVIDFSAFAGRDIIIYNDAPAPFPGGAPINDYFVGNPRNPIIPAPGFGPDTRQLLRISVRNIAAAPANNGPFLQNLNQLDPPALATLPTNLPATLTPATVVPVLTAPGTATPRPLTLNEAFDRYGRLIQMLGTTVPQVGGGFGQPLTNTPTEVVKAGTMEVWQIYNTTADTHPMHFHLVNAQVLSRQPFKITGGVPVVSGVARGPDANELGWKETIKMNPGEVTSILMQFDLPTTPFVVPSSPRVAGSLALLPGTTTAHEYVWHCHILEHEEHDMMRPIVVGS